MNKDKMIEAMRDNVAMYAPDVLTACNNYMICKAYEQAIAETAREIETKVLADNVYMIDDKYIERINEAAERGGTSRRETSGRITRPFDTYKMADSDFQDYLGKCYAEYVKAGIAHPQGRGYIPEAPAKEARLKAENALLDVYEKITEGVIPHSDYERMRKHWKYREKLIELALDTQKLEDVKED